MEAKKTLEQIQAEIGRGALVEIRLIENKNVGTEVMMPFLGLYGEGVSIEMGQTLRAVYAYADQSERISRMSTEDLLDWYDGMTRSQSTAMRKNLIGKLINQVYNELTKRLGERWNKGRVRLK